MLATLDGEFEKASSLAKPAPKAAPIEVKVAASRSDPAPVRSATVDSAPAPKKRQVEAMPEKKEDLFPRVDLSSKLDTICSVILSLHRKWEIATGKRERHRWMM